MNKQMKNHATLLAKLKTILIQNGISSDCSKEVFFDVPPKNIKCHIGVYNLKSLPFYIKTAYAESFSSNQALRYPAQIEEMPTEVEIWFVYDGVGFDHNRYRRCKSKIKEIIGREQVMSVEQFKQRIIKLIKKAPKR